MNPQFFSHLRSGLVAFGLLAAVSSPAAAAPLTAGFDRAAILPATSDKLPNLELVGGSRFADCYRDGRCDRRYRRNHLRYKYWDDDNWHSRRHYRKHRRHYNVYPNFYLGLGIPAYRYVQPRRHYRRNLGSAHVSWCYDRWLSYRAWDNTYQPYYGPRRQCWSPFSG